MWNDLILAGISERAVNVLDTASILDFGPYNRIHRHLMGNYIFYWATFGAGLLLFALTVEFANFGFLKGLLYAFPILTVYWIWLVQWVIPRFWERIIHFLSQQYVQFVGENWGMFINTLDIQQIIAIAQEFNCFTYDRMMLLASFFDDLSKNSRMFFPLSPGLTAWGSAIFGTLMGGLLLEAVKIATLFQFNFWMTFICTISLMAAGYVFFCNGASRRHARTAQLLREAALQAPR